MGLFKKKEKEEVAVKEASAKQSTAKVAPSVKSVKATVTADADKAPAKKKTTIKISVKPTAKADTKPVEKVSAKEPAKAPAKAKTAPKGVTKPASAKPFFAATTEDDIRAAFDTAIAEAEAEILKNKAKAIGKYEFDLEVDGYHFYLIANNGQILFDSPSFTTLLGALNGLKTFKKTVSEGKFEIKVDKYNRYRFILARKYYGENYATKDQCQKCVESVKNFAMNAKILPYTPEKEAIKAFEAAKNSKRTPDDIDWKAVERAEAQATKMGKFEISNEGEKSYCFYLTANNGQILYSSRYYATEAACRNGIESFKRAAYVGNFFVDRDKFGNFRYVLKNIGSAPAFIGESYDNKAQCEKIIDSVKKFIVTATVVVG